jgi:hypothetical protein
MEAKAAAPVKGANMLLFKAFLAVQAKAAEPVQAPVMKAMQAKADAPAKSAAMQAMQAKAAEPVKAPPMKAPPCLAAPPVKAAAAKAMKAEAAEPAKAPPMKAPPCLAAPPVKAEAAKAMKAEAAEPAKAPAKKAPPVMDGWPQAVIEMMIAARLTKAKGSEWGGRNHLLDDELRQVFNKSSISSTYLLVSSIKGLTDFPLICFIKCTSFMPQRIFLWFPSSNVRSQCLIGFSFDFVNRMCVLPASKALLRASETDVL